MKKITIIIEDETPCEIRPRDLHWVQQREEEYLKDHDARVAEGWKRFIETVERQKASGELFHL